MRPSDRRALFGIGGNTTTRPACYYFDASGTDTDVNTVSSALPAMADHNDNIDADNDGRTRYDNDTDSCGTDTDAVTVCSVLPDKGDDTYARSTSDNVPFGESAYSHNARTAGVETGAKRTYSHEARNAASKNHVATQTLVQAYKNHDATQTHVQAYKNHVAKQKHGLHRDRATETETNRNINTRTHQPLGNQAHARTGFSAQHIRQVDERRAGGAGDTRVDNVTEAPGAKKCEVDNWTPGQGQTTRPVGPPFVKPAMPPPPRAISPRCFVDENVTEDRPVTSHVPFANPDRPPSPKEISPRSFANETVTKDKADLHLQVLEKNTLTL